MQSILAEARITIAEYLGDPLEKMLVVSTDNEGPVLFLKALDGIEEDPRSLDIFLKFGHDFQDSSQYVDKIIEELRSQIEVVNKELAKHGESLEPLPALARSTPEDPGARLLGAFRHLRAIVPDGRKIVWLFFPLQLSGDEVEFVGLMEGIKLRMEESTISATKLMVRESPSRLLARRYNDEKSVRIYFPFLDLQSVNARLNQQCNDPATPDEEQAQAHMLLAGFDVAEGRFDLALQRNQELLGYFRHTKDRNKESIVHNSIGDIHYLQTRFLEAQKSYEQALRISIEDEQQPLMIYQSINLGNALMMQLKFDEALKYFGAAEKLAEAARALIHQIQALERMGDCHHQLHLAPEAIESWEKGADLSRRHYYTQGLSTALERLVRIYDECGMAEERDQRQTELSGISAEHTEPALAAVAGTDLPPRKA